MTPLLNPNALLALAAAALWGGGDFSGGMGVKQVGSTLSAALRIIFVSHVFSLAVLIFLLLLRHEVLPQGALLGWGLLAGVCAAVSLSCFYIALSRGAMGASAAISGLLAAAVPAVVSTVIEGRPSLLRVVGFLGAAVAIWIIAATPAREVVGPTSHPLASPGPEVGHPAEFDAEVKFSAAKSSTTWLAVVAGIGFGVYFVALRMDNSLGVFMPMAITRIASSSLCGLGIVVLTLRSGRKSPPLQLERTAVLWALAAGVLDTGGNMLFIAATRAGRLDVAAVLASLYPVSTIVLAGWLLHERLSGRQWLGMVVAAGAVAMITL